MAKQFFSKKVLLFLFVLIIAVFVAIGCAGEKKAASSVPHPIEGKEDCLSCHQQGIAGATKMPHEERANCTECHKPEK